MAAVTGVESIELALVAANGGMPTTGWITIKDIEMGSVNLAVPPLEKIRIRVEDKAGVRWVLPGETDPASLVLNSLDLNIDAANLLFKGKVTTGATEFDAPADNEQIYYLACRLTSKPIEGKKMVWSAPALAGSAGFANALTKGGFMAISFSGDTTTPVDADGKAVSPWGYKFIDTTLPEG
ncbi:hypothetical protein ORI89_17420 [Sphingobacterium sp. UT-1RO-CII-1]|uniref:hypothetical protein n=1 Tax=Sphingobacterium sp. UT-1RO-CII-1 TaxID=2995225 RepID=UPI00227B20BF|nr:hypothetical protein [Sphingobacterium sp. UT-1RO-CII-1]MCY4781443.1 hypothetical protein [Sphingobacterium sp. UT-1RO-CII-1]